MSSEIETKEDSQANNKPQNYREEQTGHPAADTQDISNAGWLTLSNDEKILWWGHPSIVPHFPIIGLGIIMMLFGIGATVSFYSDYGLWPLTLVVFGLVLTVFEYMKVISTFYVITDDKIVRKIGIIRRDAIGIRYENIEHSRALQNIAERLVGFGDIEISTAGTSSSEAYLDNIREPRNVAELINQNKDDAFNAMRYRD